MSLRNFWTNLGENTPDGIDYEDCPECRAPMIPREAVDEDGGYIVWDCLECQSAETEQQQKHGTSNS